MIKIPKETLHHLHLTSYQLFYQILQEMKKTDCVLSFKYTIRIPSANTIINQFYEIQANYTMYRENKI